MTMTHPGLPEMWVYTILALMAAVGFWALFTSQPGQKEFSTFNLSRLPLIGRLVNYLLTTPWLLLTLKLVMVVLFLLVIIAGLYGTPVPERNIATILTWNLWWAGLIFSIFFSVKVTSLSFATFFHQWRTPQKTYRYAVHHKKTRFCNIPVLRHSSL